MAIQPQKYQRNTSSQKNTPHPFNDQVKKIVYASESSARKRQSALTKLANMNFSLNMIENNDLKKRFIERFLLEDENKQRAVSWIIKIADEEWENLFPINGKRVLVPFERLFKKAISIDMDRFKISNKQFAGKKLTLDELRAMYKGLAIALHRLRTNHVLEYPSIIRQIENDLQNHLTNYVNNINIVLWRLYPVQRGPYCLYKSSWVGMTHISDLLLAQTPSVEVFTEAQMGETIYSSTHFIRGIYFASMWSLACEAAENSNLPLRFAKKYSVMNSMGLRKSCSEVLPDLIEEIDGGRDIAEWYLDFVEGHYAHCENIHSQIVSAARILAEKTDLVESGKVPDEIFFKSYRGDYHIPPVVFTAYSAFKTKTPHDFDQFMKKHVLDIVSRFESNYTLWKESDEFKSEAAALPGQSISDWTTLPLPGTMSQGQLASQDRMDIQDYYVKLFQHYYPVNRSAIPQTYEMEQILPDITNWTSPKVASLISKITGWFPNDMSLLKQYPEWVDSLFEMSWVRYQRLSNSLKMLDLERVTGKNRQLFDMLSSNMDLWTGYEPFCSGDTQNPCFSDSFLRKAVLFLAMCLREESFEDGLDKAAAKAMKYRFLSNALVKGMESLPGATPDVLSRALQTQMSTYIEDNFYFGKVFKEAYAEHTAKNEYTGQGTSLLDKTDYGRKHNRKIMNMAERIYRNEKSIQNDFLVAEKQAWVTSPADGAGSPLLNEMDAMDFPVFI